MAAPFAAGAPRLFSPLRAAVVILATLVFAPAHAQTAVTPVATSARLGTPAGVSEADPGEIQLLVGRSAVLNVTVPITRVSLSSPEIADALVTSSQQLLIHGKAPGTISLFVWERGGAVRRYEVTVERDLSQLAEQMRQLFPGEPIVVAGNGSDVVLSGIVSSKYIIEKAADVAVGYVAKKENVVNLLRQEPGVGADQVMLRVRFAEVSRTALTELGASFFTGPNGRKIGGDVYLGRSTTQQFPAPEFDKDRGLVFSDFLNLFVFNASEQLGTLVRALQTRGLFQSLAEPNLIAENGKEASFLAGGEFPFPVVQGAGAALAITIHFKEFGVKLNFTPTITGPDLIHLKVRPEVSSLDFTNAVTVQGSRIPALITRRTETSVELRNGQTFAIAGLMNNTVTSSLQKIPGIGDIPILGLLFRSKAAQKGQTELVVMITPLIVRPGSPGVAPALPNPIEPYLAPPKKTLPSPPAWPRAPESRGARSAPAVTPAPPATAPATVEAASPATATPATAAQATRATPPQPPIAAPAPPMTAAPAQPAPAPPRPAAAPERVAPAQPPAPATPAMTKQERAALARARMEERERQEREAKLRVEEEKRAAEQAGRERRQAEKVRAAQAELERKKAGEDRKVAAAQARERAKQEAATARRLAEDAKRREEFERKRGKALAEAEARLKAAQAAYQAEMERTKKKPSSPPD